MRKPLLLTSLMTFVICATAQDSSVDSLQRVLQGQQNDTAKINTLNTLSHRIIQDRGDLESGIQYAQAAATLAQKLNFKKGIGVASVRIGQAEFSRGNISEALNHFLAASKVFQQINDKANLAWAYVGIGQAYLRQSKASDTRKYYLAALNLRKQLGDKAGEAYCYLNLSDLHDELEEDYPEALRYGYAALKLFEEINHKSGIAQAIYAIGWNNYRQGNYAEALNRYRMALQLYQELGEAGWMAVMQRNLGEIYFLQGNYTEAMRYDSAALHFFEKMQDKASMGWTYTGLGNVHEKQALALERQNEPAFRMGLGVALRCYFLALKSWEEIKSSVNVSDASIYIANVYLLLKRPKDAEHYLQKSLPFARAVGSKEKLKKYYLALSRLDSSQGRYAQAYANYKKFVVYRDSLFNEENTKKFLQSAHQYEQEKKETIAKVEQQKKEAEQQRDRNRLYSILIALGLLVVVFLLIAYIQWKYKRQKQKANALLQRQKQETEQQKEKAEKALDELRTTQVQLIQKEKMASLGELTAGIAHEIQNPLNFVNNFSDISIELADELKKEAAEGNRSDVMLLAEDIKSNLQKVAQHGRRADAIVKSMLQHSRGASGERQPTGINALVEEHLRLAYHSYRAKDKDFATELTTSYDAAAGRVNVVPQEIGRVLLNLFTNAFYAVSQKKAQLNGTFKPLVTVRTERKGEQLVITVKDNGTGMSPKVAEKAFQPFFTTKPTGEGTGLGLSLSYDIITKSHGGDLKVKSNEGEGTEFIINLPVRDV